jgi:Domain of unknown function (DUF4148)
VRCDKLHALLNSAAYFQLLFIHLFWSFLMKSIRIATIALLATAAVSAFAAKDTGDRYESAAPSSIATSSSLSRAQVQAEAIKANRENLKRFSSGERGELSLGAPVTPSNSSLSREAVRAEVTKARNTTIVVDSSS